MVAMVLLTIILVRQQVQVPGFLHLAMGRLTQTACWEAPGCSAMAAGTPPATVCIIYGDASAAVRRHSA